VEIAEQILRLTHLRLEDEQSGVFLRTEGGVFAPLNFRGAGAPDVLDPNDSAMAECWRSGKVVRVGPDSAEPGHSRRLFLPLRVGKGTLGVLVMSPPPKVDLGAIDAFMGELDELCLRLDTAMAFDEVRSLVSADERQRVAREIHDGVAQEVASLGYLVDDISSNTDNPEALKELHKLRGELSRVVSELRLSIFDLRTNVGADGGLGSALSEHARTIGRQAGITVHLTLDEAPARLTPTVETEMLRIAQEAITNARKHSAAKNLWIHCLVEPPAALIEIHDDGRGLGACRNDSFGLKIMRERAERIGAELTIASRRNSPSLSGTSVTISVGATKATRLGESVL
jgi:nitrate/nitrite-specific signal transduction histidine kinase